jgi:UDP-N-acetylglucosamine 4,6-dehydratase
MRGGEIFVPKLPAISMVDLAKTLSPHSEINVVGIRPGEKVHEKLISCNERNVREEYDRFIVYPSYNILMDDENYHVVAEPYGRDYSSDLPPLTPFGLNKLLEV